MNNAPLRGHDDYWTDGGSVALYCDEEESTFDSTNDTKVQIIRLLYFETDLS